MITLIIEIMLLRTKNLQFNKGQAFKNQQIIIKKILFDLHSRIIKKDSLKDALKTSKNIIITPIDKLMK